MGGETECVSTASSTPERIPVPPGLAAFGPESVLRRSLLAEYVSMLWIITAALGGLCWLIEVARNPSAMLLPLISIWIIMRCSGQVRIRTWISLVTASCVGLLQWFRECEGCWPETVWLRAGPISARSYLLLLTVVLAADMIDTWRWWRLTR